MKKYGVLIFVLVFVYLFIKIPIAKAGEKISKKDMEEFAAELKSAAEYEKKMQVLRKNSAPPGQDRFERDKEMLKQAFPDLQIPEPPPEIIKKYKKIRPRTMQSIAMKRIVITDNKNYHIIPIKTIKEFTAWKNIFGQNLRGNIDVRIKNSPLYRPLAKYLQSIAKISNKNAQGVKVEYVFNPYLLPLDFFVKTKMPAQVSPLIWLRKKTAAFVNFYRQQNGFSYTTATKNKKISVFLSKLPGKPMGEISIEKKDNNRKKTELKILIYFPLRGKIMVKNSQIRLEYFYFFNNFAKGATILSVDNKNLPIKQEIALKINKLLDECYFAFYPVMAPIKVMSMSVNLN